MRRSGLADSPLFTTPQRKIEMSNSLPDQPRPEKELGEVRAEKPQSTKQPSNHDATKPRNHDAVVPRYHDTTIESVRRAVKEFGKEAATHRFTVEEKRAIADVIYAYRGLGIKTSENQVARIAVNFIINDYRENGENSVLDKALRALNE
jgi:hypothetical protein